MTTIYLVRHATYDNPRGIMPGRLPVELSEKGIEEANRLKFFFKDKNIEKIFSSAVERCKQTSEIISDNLIPIEFDQRLLECFSAMQGYWVEDYRYFWGHRLELGGENNKEVQDRMVDFFTKTKFEDNKNYIICSHGDPLYYLYQFVAGITLDKDFELNDTNPPQATEDYQQKGWIREIFIKDGKYEAGKLISQEELI